MENRNYTNKRKAPTTACRDVEEYEILSTISQGTYGVVYKARCKETGELFALKKLKVDRSTTGGELGFPAAALREINTLHRISHPNIVHLKEIVLGRRNQVYMVLEYMEHELKALMEAKRDPFSLADTKCLLLQLLNGVNALHSSWVIHRDLKTSNLLLDNRGTLKICDLGLARAVGSPLGEHTPEVVTLWYRAPEVLLGGTYSFPVDMWAVGCIFAELLRNKPLFQGIQREVELVDAIFRLLGTPTEESWPGFESLPYVKAFKWKIHKHSSLHEEFPRHSYMQSGVSLSDSGFDLLSRMLCPDPCSRITAEEALEHPWFRETPFPQHPSMVSLTLPVHRSASSHKN